MTITFKTLSIRAIQAMMASATINVGLFFLFKQLNIIDTNLPVSPDGSPLSLAPVLFASTLPMLVAGIVFWALKQFFSKRFIVIFRVLASVMLVLSFGTPFTIDQVTKSMAMALNLMHIVVAMATVYFFTLSAAGDEK